MRLFRLGLLIASLVLAEPALAAQNEATRTTAREVATQGLADYDAGRYEQAADKLVSAFEAVPLPTLAVYAARALEKTGHLIRASELYLKAQQLKPDPTWQAVQLETQQKAAEERAKLVPRIPRLEVHLQGATPEEVEVAIDGLVIPRSLLGQPQLVDPGKRKVTGRRHLEQVEEEIEAHESQTGSVTLRFTAPAPVAGPPPKTPIVSLAGAPAPVDDGSQKRKTQRLLGWIGIGVGAAGVGFGLTTGLIASGQRSNLLDDGCEDTHCYTQQKGDVDSYNQMRTLSTIGFVAGGVIAAAGVTLLLTTPSESKAAAALHLGPQGAALEGRF